MSKTLETFLYLTSANVDNLGGYFQNDVSQQNTSIKEQLASQNYNSSVLVTGVTIARSGAWQKMFSDNTYIYEVWFGYTDSTNTFQQSSTFSAYPYDGYGYPIPITCGGYDITRTQSGSTYFLFKPNGSMNLGLIPKTGLIDVRVNAWMLLGGSVGGPFPAKVFWQGWTYYIDNLTVSTQFDMDLPNWLQNGFWAQTGYAMGGNDDSQGNALATQLANGVWAPVDSINTNPDFDTAFMPMVVGRNYIEFYNPSEETQGQPTCTVQINMNTLPNTQYGNRTVGQPLFIFTLMGQTGNQISWDINTFFIEQTKQTMINAQQQLWTIYFTDKSNLPFISLLASFDFNIGLKQNSFT